jgi:hypothetical protein
LRVWLRRLVLRNEPDVKEGGIGVDELEQKQLRNHGVFILRVSAVVLTVRQHSGQELEQEVEDLDLGSVQNGRDCLGRCPHFFRERVPYQVNADHLSTKKCSRIDAPVTQRVAGFMWYAYCHTHAGYALTLTLTLTLTLDSL